MSSTTDATIRYAAISFAATALMMAAQPRAAHASTVAIVQDPSGHEVSCTIVSDSGPRACDGLSAEHSCDAEPRDASQPSNQSTDIAFVNSGSRPVNIYWLNVQGQRVLYVKDLAPGARQTQRTFVGHNWLIATQSDQCVGIFNTAPDERDDDSPYAALARVAPPNASPHGTSTAAPSKRPARRSASASLA
jgi:hypothetical protein